MAIYKHGVYSEKVSSTPVGTAVSLGTIPVYIGTLPVQRANANGEESFDYTPYINKPILVERYNDVRSLYSDDWENYTLCEAISAHFLNGSDVIAPIILINILDPATHLLPSAKTATVLMNAEGANKVGYIDDPLCSVDDLTITVSPELQATEYSVAYEGDRVKITVTKEGFSEASVQVSYKQIDATPTTIDADVFTPALTALDHCEMETGYIPNVLCAPRFSEVPEIHKLMIEKINEKISGKWFFITVSDIPCDTNKTLESAIAWKKTNGYNNVYDKVCFPKVVFNGKTYHLSTVTTFTMQKTDLDNDDVPYVSPSNKVINADGAILGDGTPIYISEGKANSVNEVGITTVNIIKRKLRLWGSHMANYDFSGVDSISYEDRGDANVRMMLYLLNYLQYNFIDEIDTAFTRKDIDSVKTGVQQWLNSLVNEGKLLYATIDFTESENSTATMVNGDFVFEVATTLTPNAKSITFKVSYTENGLTLLTSDGGEA